MTSRRDLSEVERQMLRFEAQVPVGGTGAKEQAIRDLFDMDRTRYLQVLDQLIDQPAALAAEPQVVNRLRARREQGRLRRARRRPGANA